MRFSENVVTVLALKSMKGIGNAWIVNHFHPSTPLEVLVARMNEKRKPLEWMSIEKFMQIRAYFASQLEQLSHTQGAVALGDEDFPPYRGSVNAGERPVLLFYRGNINLLKRENHNVAVIGLLQPTPQIEACEREVVERLVANGVSIVSGLALGCDGIAHHQALQSGGNTVAILPSSLEHILPTAHRELASEIVERGGLLVSEYYKEPTSRNAFIQRYIQRDRLQALFSDAIILSASYAPNKQGLDSGSRHAMQKALKYGIRRAVIYNETRDALNACYDLNREILQRDKRVLSLHKESLEGALNTLLVRDKREASLFE